MDFAKEILDAIEIMVKQVVEDNTTKIYTGVCKSASSNGTCELEINGKTNTVKYYGDIPKYNDVYRVFIPFGNMSAAFIIVPGEPEEPVTEITSYNELTDLPKVNGATLIGNKSSADLGLYGTNNTPPYPVTSVNNKTGAVKLTASDVGAMPSDTVIPTVNNATLSIQKNGSTIGTFTANSSENKTVNVAVPTKTSDITNDSGFITDANVAVKSVNNKTGNVVLSAADVGALPLTGGELSGNVKIKNPNNAYYELNDGTTRWFLQCYEGNCGMGPSWKDATVWTPNGDMTVKGSTTINDNLSVGGATISKGSSADIIGTTKEATTVSNQVVLQQGAVFSGTAASAGLVTRGICGVTTPENNGACQKENLYINYDSTNEYSSNRQLVLQAGNVGAHYGNNLYQYTAARGDAVKNWVEAKGYITSSDIPVKSVNGKTGAVTLSSSDVGAISTSNISQTLGSSTTKVPSEKAVQDAIVASGGGDMLKTVYDPNNTVANAGGIVNYVNSHGPAIAIQSAQPTQSNGDIWFQVT